MRVPVPRLGQLAHLFSVNPATVFKRKNILPSIRRHRDPLDSDDTALPSPTSTSSDAEPKSAVETVPDDRTLVESRRHSSQSGEADSILLSDVPEDKVYVKPQRVSRQPPSSSEPPDPFTRLSIIYPLPTAENLLAHESAHPPPVMDAPPPSSCIPAALAPPPTHYKRGRARVMSNEGHDPDPDQLSNSPNIDPDTALRFPF